MIKAFVFIETAVGKKEEVAKALKGLSGIDDAVSVYGPFDCVATVSAETVNDIGDLVAGCIQQMRGIVRTTTCVVVM